MINLGREWRKMELFMNIYKMYKTFTTKKEGYHDTRFRNYVLKERTIKTEEKREWKTQNKKIMKINYYLIK